MKMKPTSKDFLYGDPEEPGAISVYFIYSGTGRCIFSQNSCIGAGYETDGRCIFDESNLMDIKALSTYGVTQDDVDAILKNRRSRTCRGRVQRGLHADRR